MNMILPRFTNLNRRLRDDGNASNYDFIVNVDNYDYIDDEAVRDAAAREDINEADWQAVSYPSIAPTSSSKRPYTTITTMNTSTYTTHDLMQCNCNSIDNDNVNGGIVYYCKVNDGEYRPMIKCGSDFSAGASLRPHAPGA